MNFGYCRVSTREQNEQRQIDALRLAGIEEENLFVDKVSGAKVSRPALDDLLSRLREGDSVTVLSFDRLARSTKQLLDLAENFQSMGVDLVSIHERIDTGTPQGKLFFTISAAFSEFERALIRERQAEGIASAKAAGRRLGRRPVPKEKLQHAMALYESGSYTIYECCKLAGISESVFYRYRRSITEA